MQARTLKQAAQRGRNSRLWSLRAAAVAATVGLLLMAAPLIWKVVAAGAGLLALAALAVVGAVALQTLPWGLQRMENRLLARRKAEARSYPIEQLQNDVLRREAALREHRQALVSIGAQIESMAQMIETRRRSDPTHVLQRQQQALQRMTQFHEVNLQRLHTAGEALDAFRHQVQQKVFEWEFHVAGRSVLEVLNPADAQAFTSRLLTDEALRSVQQRFNEVFAELDIELRAATAPTHELLPQPPELEPPDAPALPMDPAARRLA
jgi:hypothetical protein